MTRSLRTAIIGGSHWHVPLYLEAMARYHDVVVVHDPDPVRAAQLIPGAPSTTSVEEAFHSGGIELAYIFGPHDQMAAACDLAIDREIPFVVEKPGALSLKDLTRIVDRAAEARVPATVPLVQRDAPVETWLRQGGQASYFRASFIAGPPERYICNGNPWMLEKARSGGGAAINLAPHFVDMFLRLTSSYQEDGTSIPLHVQASFESRLHGGEVEDHGTILLRTKDGREGVIEIGYAFPDSPLKRASGYSVAGSEGYAEIVSDGHSTLVSTGGELTSDVIDPDSDPLYAQFVAKVAESFSQHGEFVGLPTLRELHTVMSVIWESYEVTSSISWEERQ